MEVWKTYKLGEVCSRLRSGKGIPSSLVAPSGEYPVIGGNGVRGYAVQSNFDGECGVIGRQGAYCGNVRYFNGSAYMTEHAIVVVGNEKADTYYLTALLSTMNLGHLSAQSAQPGLSVQTLSKQEITLPSLATQRRVSAILKSLDNKIELNNRINHNLEEQAKALYKSWFVDFEPFKDGKFVESELGMIPEGWSTISFRDFLTPVSRKIPVGMYPEYSVTNTGIIPRSEKFKKQLSCNSSLNKELRRYDIVFGMSREILNWGIMLDEVGSVSSAYNIYDINENVIHPLYLKYFIEQRIWYFNDLIGTAAREGQSLDKGALMQKYAIIPPLNVISSFMGKDNAYRDQILANESETTSLESLRDTILPKLMCGELNINEIDC